MSFTKFWGFGICFGTVKLFLVAYNRLGGLYFLLALPGGYTSVPLPFSTSGPHFGEWLVESNYRSRVWFIHKPQTLKVSVYFLFKPVFFWFLCQIIMCVSLTVQHFLIDLSVYHLFCVPLLLLFGLSFCLILTRCLRILFQYMYYFSCIHFQLIPHLCICLLVIIYYVCHSFFLARLVPFLISFELFPTSILISILINTNRLCSVMSVLTNIHILTLYITNRLICTLIG